MWEIVRSVVAALIFLWLSNLSLEGLFSTALESTHAFKEWLSDPLEIPRWNMLAMLTVIVIAIIGFITAYISSKSKRGSSTDELALSLTNAFTQAADDIAAAPSVPEHFQLTQPHVQTLEYLAERYSQKHGLSGRQVKEVAVQDIARKIELSLLRAEQVLEQLSELGMVKHLINLNTGKMFYLSPKGRDWLLRNGHA